MSPNFETPRENDDCQWMNYALSRLGGLTYDELEEWLYDMSTTDMAEELGIPFTEWMLGV